MKSQISSKTVSQLKKQSEDVSGLLKQLSHPQRLLILCSLAQGEKTVGEIETFTGASQSSVSQFLKSLRLDRLVESKRDGKYVVYQIADSRVLELMKSLYLIFCKQ